MTSCAAIKFSVEQDLRRQSDARSVLFDYIRFPACKRLVNSILRAQADTQSKSIAVLSPFPVEGKSVLISSVALGYMLLLGKRVLIMDTVSQSCDESFYFREVSEQRSHAALPPKKRLGCIDLITTKNLSRRALMQSHKETVSACDPDMPIAYEPKMHFDSADFHVNPFVNSLKEFYDLILMDTCALSEASKDTFDPLILAEHADTSLIFMSHDTLNRRTLSSLSRELKRQRIVPLGIVVDSSIANGH